MKKWTAEEIELKQIEKLSHCTHTAPVSPTAFIHAVNAENADACSCYSKEATNLVIGCNIKINATLAVECIMKFFLMEKIRTSIYSNNSSIAFKDNLKSSKYFEIRRQKWGYFTFVVQGFSKLI